MISMSAMRRYGKARSRSQQLCLIAWQKHVYLTAQIGQAACQDTPYHLMVDVSVPVDQPIAKRNDPLMVTNSRGKSRVPSEHLIERFTDNLKLAFHSGSKHGVGGVIVECLASCKLASQLTGLLDIIQVFSDFQRQHTIPVSLVRSPAENTGYESPVARPNQLAGRTSGVAPP
jgi:hypothetical protein